MLNSIVDDSLKIRKSENRVNNNNMRAFRANNNKLEKSPERDGLDKNKKQNGLIITLGSIAAVLAALGIICYSKGKGVEEANKSFKDKMKDGWKLLFGKGEKAAASADEEALKAAEKAKKAEEEAKKAAEEAEAAKKKADEEAAKKLEEERKLNEEEHKISLKQLMEKDDINIYLKRSAKTDDTEVAELIYNDLKKKNLSINYSTLVHMPDRYIYPANVVIEKALETTSPLEKESLLAKAADLLTNNKRIHSFLSEGIAQKLSEISKELEKLYQTKGVEFKHKGYDKTLHKKSIDMLKQHSYQYRMSTKDIPFEVDYELYQKLLKESEEYKDFFGKKTDPMHWGDKVKPFLCDVFPKMIKEEGDIAAKESLYEKYLLLLKNKHGQTQYTEEYFKKLLEMNEIFYKDGKEAAEKLGLEKYDFVQEEIEKVMDEYIFSKFKLESIATHEEKFELAKQVITRSNSKFLNFFSDDVRYEHVAKGLKQMWIETGSEKYFKEALDILEKNKDIKQALNFIESMDAYAGKHAEQSPEFKAFLSKKQNEYKEIIENNVNSVIKKFEKTSLKESFDKMISSNKEFPAAIDDIAKSNGISAEQVREKMMSGDYETIRSVLKDAIVKSDSEGFLFKEAKASPIWDDIINYLGNIEEVVKDPVELEKLKNYRIRAIGAKVLEFKKTNPDVANGYMKLLKEEITNVIYGTSKNGLTKEAVNQNVINELAKEIGDLIYVPYPEKTIYETMERCMEKTSNVEYSTWKNLRAQIKERLKIEDWSDEDFYEYFKRFFGGGRGSGKTIHQSKESAIDVLNKYLDGNKLSPDSSPEEIKAAYRKLALKYHPDKCVQNGENPEVNKEIFQEIGNAYDALKKSMGN